MKVQTQVQKHTSLSEKFQISQLAFWLTEINNIANLSMLYSYVVLI